MDLYVQQFRRFLRLHKNFTRILAGTGVFLVLITCYILINRPAHALTDADGAAYGEVVAGAADEAGAADAADQTEAAYIYVDVSGAVVSPMVIELDAGSRVFDAIERAGGLREDACVRYLNRAAVLVDGDRVYVPTNDEAAAALKEGAGGSAADTLSRTLMESSAGYEAPTVAPAPEETDGKVNINTADAQGLQRITGVGPSTAEKIIAYRSSAGPFAAIEDIQNVSGIGPKTFEKMKDQITV
jgi:competence protein ComEA